MKTVSSKKKKLDDLIKFKKDKLFFPILPIINKVKDKIDKVKDEIKGGKGDKGKGDKGKGPVDIEINTNGADGGSGGKFVVNRHTK